MAESESRTNQLLEEILKWTKFAGSKGVKETLMFALDTNQKKLVYHLSDGKRGTVEISELAGVGHTTVSNYWESWLRQGIVEPIKVKGGNRYHKSFELEDFGISVPPLPSSTTPQSPPKEKPAEDQGTLI
jgi:hypothetical protein